MLMHLAVARETARGLGEEKKQNMGMASWSTHLTSTKISIWLALRGGRGGKVPWQRGEVCFGDSDGLGEADWERETALYLLAFELHQWHTFNWLWCQKIWHQHIWGRDAWSKWGYDCEPCLCALSMFYQDCATGVARRIVCVPSQELTLTPHIRKKLSAEEKCLIKCMMYIHVTIREHDGKMMSWPRI